jgi:hypothetical protein
MAHRSKEDNPKKEYQYEVEDFGYNIKNVARHSKKQVNKFKREARWNEDS